MNFLWHLFTHIQISIQTNTLSLCVILCVKTCDPYTWLYTTEFQLCRDNVHIFILYTSPNDIYAHTRISFLASFRMQADAARTEWLCSERNRGMCWLSNVIEIQLKCYETLWNMFRIINGYVDMWMDGWMENSEVDCAHYLATFLQATYHIYFVIFIRS